MNDRGHSLISSLVRPPKSDPSHPFFTLSATFWRVIKVASAASSPSLDFTFINVDTVRAVNLDKGRIFKDGGDADMAEMLSVNAA